MKGLKRKIDNIGRVVVPCELRKEYQLYNDTVVEFIPTEVGILIKSSEFEEGQMKNAISIINMEIEKAKGNTSVLLGLELAKRALQGGLQ
ncbi:MAG: hypothetical protein ACRCX8_05760 [Sarcina sp.]